MKKLALLLIGFTFTLSAVAQEEGNPDDGKKVASLQLEDMEGNVVNTADLGFEGPVIISFWATWCSPCKKELDALNEYYIDLQDETNVKVIAVSIDDPRTVQQVVNTVNSQAWEYDVYLDTNSDLRRAMGVNNVPHTMVYNSAGEVVYTSNKYAPGDEYHLMEVIREAAGE